MNNNDFIIRRETVNDYHNTENAAREAFWNQNRPGCDEHYFIHVLRQHRDFVPELDFVAEVGGRIVGCVMYAKSRLMDRCALSPSASVWA